MVLQKMLSSKSEAVYLLISEKFKVRNNLFLIIIKKMYNAYKFYFDFKFQKYPENTFDAMLKFMNDIPLSMRQEFIHRITEQNKTSNNN